MAETSSAEDTALVAGLTRPQLHELFYALVLARAAEERLEILKIHAAAMPLDPSTDLTQVLPLTDGFTGADLVTLCRRASFAKLQDFIAEHGEAAEAHAGAFRLCTEDFIESARTLGTKPGSSS